MEQQPMVKVRQADDARSGEWVVEWRSPMIAGPSYLFFPTREKAEEAAARIREQGASSMQPPDKESTGSTIDPTELSAAEEVLHWGQRLLEELPGGTCTEAAAGLEHALTRLREEQMD